MASDPDWRNQHARGQATNATPFARKLGTPKKAAKPNNLHGGEPTQLKVGLPLPSYPDTIRKMMDNSMTAHEWELKKAEHDLIIENAEVSCYLMLIEKAQMTEAKFLNAAEPLLLNLKDEQNMVEWIKTNSPEILSKLWPKIHSANATTFVDSDSSPTSSA